MKIKNGFTLIEALVVISIIGILFSVGFVNFRDFQRRKIVNGVIAQIQGDLRLAQSSAISGVKPTGNPSGLCNAVKIFEGFSIEIVSNVKYVINANCSNNGGQYKDILFKEVTLPTGLTIATPYPNPLIFKSLGQGTNIVSGTTWNLVVSQTGTINVGTIVVTSGGQINYINGTPAPTPTVTPTPAPAPTPTLTPTPTAPLCSSNGTTCASDGVCCSGICGTNADSDGYFSLAAGHTGICQASTLLYTDCYDGNANVFPGQTACFNWNRGDGSYDYNCDSSNEKCMGNYYSNCSCTTVGCTSGKSKCNTCGDNTVTPSCGTTFSVNDISGVSCNAVCGSCVQGSHNTTVSCK